ncbi:MAG: hypothetical protein LW808_002145 [Verrucomicrobiota bacterium]|nr:MAG: hypothetical protein LW808_002145 [Verrucomicrobiota bacterium]
MVSKLIRDIVVSLLFVGVFFGTSALASSRREIRRTASQGNTPSLLQNKKIGEEVEHNLANTLRRLVTDSNWDGVKEFLGFVQNHGLDRTETSVPEILRDVCGPGISEPQQCKLLTKAFRSEPVHVNVIRALLDNGEALNGSNPEIFGAAKGIFLQLPLERQSKLLRSYEKFEDCKTFLSAVTPDTDTPPIYQMRAPKVAALGDM